MSGVRTAVLCFALALAPGFALAHEGDAGLEQILIESASTPQQHTALAKYYRGKANAERNEAAEHKKMGAAYGGSKMTIAQAQKQHCDKLAEAHEAAAKEYDGLAAAHESLAK